MSRELVFMLAVLPLPIIAIHLIVLGVQEKRYFMKEFKEERVSRALKCLYDEGFVPILCKNGQIKIGSGNFWATTGKYYFPDTETRGTGISEFIAECKRRYK